mmetsp:Transcript_60633/g.108026  ORF Transcript_60633/g.108026 Transcript_60633/m.108026 type:complete len:89 (-) Transcript_60633:21-287(-)
MVKVLHRVLALALLHHCQHRLSVHQVSSFWYFLFVVFIARRDESLDKDISSMVNVCCIALSTVYPCIRPIHVSNLRANLLTSNLVVSS